MMRTLLGYLQTATMLKKIESVKSKYIWYGEGEFSKPVSPLSLVTDRMWDGEIFLYSNNPNSALRWLRFSISNHPRIGFLVSSQHIERVLNRCKQFFDDGEYKRIETASCLPFPKFNFSVLDYSLHYSPELGYLKLPLHLTPTANNIIHENDAKKLELPKSIASLSLTGSDHYERVNVKKVKADEFLQNISSKDEPQDGFIEIDYSMKSLPKLIKLLLYLNEKKCLDISNELILEVKRIFNFLFDPNKLDINVFKSSLPYRKLNPSANSNFELWTAMSTLKLPNYTGIDKLKENLTSGANPNELDTTGCTPLSTVVTTNNISLLKLMLGYGANPFLPNQGNFVLSKSTMDYLLFNYKKDMLSVINTHFTPLQPSLKQSHLERNILQICNIKISANSDTLETTLFFENKASIRTELFTAEKLTQLQKTAMQTLYDITFESKSADESLQQLFNEDISGKNKLIRLVYDKDKLIGYLVFELIKHKGFPNHRIIHCVCAAIDPRYGGNGLISLLSFDIAYSLQLLTSKILAAYLSIVNYQGNRVVKKLLYYPKYRSNLTDKIIQNTLEHIYQKSDFTFFSHKTMAVSIPDPLQVKGTTTKATTDEDVWRYLFNEAILERHESRAVPTLFFIDQKSLDELEKQVKYQLKDYIQNLSGSLASGFLKNIMSVFLEEEITCVKSIESLTADGSELFFQDTMRAKL